MLQMSLCPSKVVISKRGPSTLMLDMLARKVHADMKIIFLSKNN